jgi:hypothetical protein
LECWTGGDLAENPVAADWIVKFGLGLPRVQKYMFSDLKICKQQHAADTCGKGATFVHVFFHYASLWLAFGQLQMTTVTHDFLIRC